MKYNKTTTSDKIRAMDDDEYLEFKREFVGNTIRVLVNKPDLIIKRDEAIINLAGFGVSQTILAKVFGISQPAISKILSNKNKL